MRDFQHVGGEIPARCDEIALGEGLDVAGENRRAPRERHTQHERSVVFLRARVGAVPRMQHVEGQTRRREALAGAEAFQREAPAGGRVLELVEEEVARHRPRQDDARDRERRENGEKPARVIGVRVREDDGVERHGPEVGETRQEPEPPEVVLAVGAASAVDENPALGRDQKPRVSLAHVESLKPDRVPRGDDRRREDDGEHDHRDSGESRAPERGAPREARDDQECGRGRDQGERGRRHDPHRVQAVEGQEQREQDVAKVGSDKAKGKTRKGTEKGAAKAKTLTEKAVK